MCEFFNVVQKYVRLKWKKEGEYYYNYNYQIYLNMPEYAYINRILNMPPVLTKYAKIWNMAKFWIWPGSQYTIVTQSSEHGRIYLDRVTRVLNIPGFWIWQGSEYARITQGSNFM